MRSFITALCLVATLAVAVPSAADARCGIFGCRSAGAFRPFQGFRARRAAGSRFQLFSRSRSSAASGCSDCAAHGVGPDGFPVKK
jgi:hypothetical protein